MVTRFVERIAKIREAIGDDIDLAVDFHGRVSPAMAPWLCRELEPYGLMFIEEPVLPENVDVMAKIARMTTIPIATGERKFTTFEYREVLEKQAATVLQPDVCHAGGISQVMKLQQWEKIIIALLPLTIHWDRWLWQRAYRLIPLYQTLLHRNIQLWKRAGISEQFYLKKPFEIVEVILRFHRDLD